MALPDPKCAPARIAQDLRHRRAFGRYVRVVGRESARVFGNRCEAVLVMIAACEKAGARGRTQCRSVPLSIDQTVVSKPLQRRHIDPAAERRPCSKTGVVVEYDEHIWRVVWCYVGQEG